MVIPWQSELQHLVHNPSTLWDGPGSTKPPDVPWTNAVTEGATKRLGPSIHHGHSLPEPGLSQRGPRLRICTGCSQKYGETGARVPEPSVSLALQCVLYTYYVSYKLPQLTLTLSLSSRRF